MFHNPFRLCTASSGAPEGCRSVEPANISGAMTAMTAKLAGATLAGGPGWTSCLADREDKERRRLAGVWVAFVGLVRRDSELLLELGDCSQERILQLLLDRAPATLRANLGG